jgi:hypothetical protein
MGRDSVSGFPHIGAPNKVRNPMNIFASRRSLLKCLALTAGAVVGARAARSAELTRLDPREPAAAALGYVENAAQIDGKKYPADGQGSECDKCLQLQGKSGAEQRPCALFPGKLVAVTGWCTAWTAEM